MSEDQKESWVSRKPNTLEEALDVIKELRTENEALRDQITFDGLTREYGIYREEAAKKKAMKWFQENNFPEAGIIRIDMANLREINNRYTHEVGNQAIKAFGRFLKLIVEEAKKTPEAKEALAFRVHDVGDEFGLFFLGISPKRISEIMEAMKSMPPPLEVKDKKIELGFTVGRATTQQFEVDEQIKILKSLSPQQKAAEIWNILNTTAGSEERYARKIAKSEKSNYG